MAIVNQGIDNNSPQSLDRSYGRLQASKTVPYTSVAQANAAVPSFFRHIGKCVLIDLGDGPVEYWWKDGTTDPDLVVKSSSANTGPVSITLTEDGTYVLAENFLIDKIVVIPSSSFDLKVGLSLGASDLMPEIQMISGQANVINLDVPAWGGSVTIYFGNIPASTIFLIYRRTLIPA